MAAPSHAPASLPARIPAAALRALGAVRLAGAIVIAGLAGVSGIAAAPLPGPDTSHVHLEIGPGMDLTNELYYQDAYVDTTFLRRQLVATPETRFAGVWLGALQGTRGERSTSYLLQNELSLGDLIQRDALALAWRQEVASGWRLLLDPAVAWRHDRTFDRNDQEWHEGMRARLRRTLDDDATSIEGGVTGDLLRTTGPGSQFVLDRNSLGALLALDRLPLFGDEWRLAWGVTDRVFPDSSERNHDEYAWEGRWRHGFGGGHALLFETAGQRRLTHHIVTTSRDNFWSESGALETDARLSDRWSLRLRVEGDALQYDLEDSTLFFDYRIARARLGARFEREARWSITAGPRAEALSSPLAPGESYREIGGEVELEVLGGRSWWNVTPAGGYRAYDQTAQVGLPGALHSSFAYASLEAFVDQALPGRLRLRALTSLRYESHLDPSQNAASIYLSLQLRETLR
ncbi:MAG: hypothetical protein HY076_07835 [Candidatus Eisenbacteria bacterium]|uniref:Uncharacterized protein n=1 Tax=Eiseniibacteriota bacterium TaxID=2212470 RepID=A0A9D6LB33_UNCEI|nr:hypothetical protein [Candidatus Eisenbacteria bacterium]MBI3540167.1 hypothetical protein [Candidatus Eisenbacteria bacterium]